MKNTIRKILVKLKLLEVKKQQTQTPITFPGGITPINETNPEDVFIVGFPKSGNTLMQHIITHLVYGLNDEVSRSMVNLITPDIYANPYYFRFNKVCYFKSHERPQPSYKKVIYLLRDGREAILSYYHMMKNMGKEISLEDLYNGNISINGGTWSEHINSWEENPYNANILYVKYEDLRNDKLNQLKKICAFLNISRTDNELNNVLKFTSFEFMKTIEQKEDWETMNKSSNLIHGNFVRKGSTNSFKEEVNNDILEKFTENSKNGFYKF